MKKLLLAVAVVAAAATSAQAEIAIPKRPAADFTFLPLEGGKRVWVTPRGATAYIYARLVPLLQDKWRSQNRNSVLADCRVQNTRREYLCEVVSR